MFHQRPISSKLGTAKQNKPGFQVIELIGDRYVLTLKAGVIDRMQQYTSPNKFDNAQYLARLETIIQSNDYLFDYTGILEVMMNDFNFKIIDIVEDDDQNQNKVYEDRLDLLYNEVGDPNILIPKKTVIYFHTSVAVATMYRRLDCAYKYGEDYYVIPSIRESVFVIVGETVEHRESKILIPKTGYDNYSKVPKILKGACRTLEDVNNLKDQLFDMDDCVITLKNNIEHVEFENIEKNRMYIVVGKCNSTNQYKVFGKVKPSHRLSVIDNTPSPNVHFDYVNEKFNGGDNIFYHNGYVVSCSTPKVNNKTLASVCVFDVKQCIDLNQPIETEIDEIPTLHMQQIKKKMSTIPTNILAVELANRLLQIPEYHDIGIELQNVSEQAKNSTTHKKDIDQEDSDSEDDDEPVKKKQKL